MDLLDIPGYAEAVLKERTVRDAAFLGVTESIGPFEVTPITLRQWIILRLSNNPLLFGGTPSPVDLVNFLWILAPDYAPTARRRKSFERRCRRLFYPPRYLAILNTKKARARHELKKQKRMIEAAKIVDAARAFVAETMQDRPPVPKTLGFEADYFSDGAYFCAVFGREFGWSQEEVLHTPLKRLFQYLNEMKHYHRAPVPLCNPSDRVKAQWLASIQPRKQRPNGH